MSQEWKNPEDLPYGPRNPDYEVDGYYQKLIDEEEERRDAENNLAEHSAK